MKNAIISFLGAAAAVFAFATMMMTESTIKTQYNRDALVIYSEERYIGVVTIDGNEWEFFADDTFEVGDAVQVTFYNNMTDTDIYDDEIIKAKKIEKNVDKTLKEW